MPPSPLVPSSGDSAIRCRSCGSVVEQPQPSVSCHRTSEGTVRYTRCSCGAPQIWLRPATYGYTEVLHG